MAVVCLDMFMVCVVVCLDMFMICGSGLCGYVFDVCSGLDMFICGGSGLPG